MYSIFIIVFFTLRIVLNDVRNIFRLERSLFFSFLATDHMERFEPVDLLLFDEYTCLSVQTYYISIAYRAGYSMPVISCKIKPLKFLFLRNNLP